MGVPGFERSHHLHRRLCFFTLRGLFSFTHYEGRGGSHAPPTAVVSLHFHGRSTLFFHPRWLPLASHTPNPPALSLPPLFPLSSRPPPVPHPPLTRPLPAPYPPPTRPPPAPHPPWLTHPALTHPYHPTSLPPPPPELTHIP